MISCIPGTVLDSPDKRIIGRMSSDWPNIDFDSKFLDALPDFHGGVPTHPYFASKSGQIHRIAFFLYFVDEDSDLHGAVRESKNYFHDSMDERVTDRGVDYIVGCDVNGFFDGDRIVPFAALYTPLEPNGNYEDPNDPAAHLTLTPLDTVNCNALCFDTSTEPHSVVVFDAAKSAAEQHRYCDDCVELDEIQYDSFIECAAETFLEFTRMLTDSPDKLTT
ncbi:hypothetical protein [Planctomycetes bacterium CA13]